MEAERERGREGKSENEQADRSGLVFLIAPDRADNRLGCLDWLAHPILFAHTDGSTREMTWKLTTSI